MSKALNRATLSKLRSWWFQECPKEQHASPPKEIMMKWYSQSDDVDAQCRADYGPAVEEAKSMSQEEIMSLVETPQEALSAVVLLDQMPRNIYRGLEAVQVHKIYDPKASALAKAYLSPPYEYGDRQHFSNFLEQSLLFLPLMHSESAADHELLARLLKKRADQAEHDAERKGIEMTQNFETKHYAVIKRFGRYPSRNACMGRESTEEEVEFLKDGPGW